MPSDESTLWERILEVPLVNEKMTGQGYFVSTRPFREMLSVLGVQMKLGTPRYLSKDFWSRQPTFLVEQGYYVLRTGRGKFALLDERVFPKPYVSLQTAVAKELKHDIPHGYEELRRAFGQSAQESATLEQMRFFGVFEKIVADLFGAREYIIGPRGSRSSSFDVFIQDMSLHKIKLYTYEGLEELDYSIWTRDSALLLEAKQTDRSTGFLDVGWHKLVYPASRYKGGKTALYPAYFLRRKDDVHIFVFPKVQFYKSGIVLNDPTSMVPQEIYRIST